MLNDHLGRAIAGSGKSEIAVGDAGSVPVTCPACASNEVRTSLDVESFDYAIDEQTTVALDAPVRVHTCENCGEEFTSGDAEEARHEAVCNYLGRLRPVAIRELRKKYDRTRKEFARDTGLGEASIGRWESAAAIQTASIDAYLRLLMIEENYEATRAILNPEADLDSRRAERGCRVRTSRVAAFKVDQARARSRHFHLCRRGQ